MGDSPLRVWGDEAEVDPATGTCGGKKVFSYL